MKNSFEYEIAPVELGSTGDSPVEFTMEDCFNNPLDNIVFDFEFDLPKDEKKKSTNTTNRRPKNIMCTHWLRGLCIKGDECDYLHQLDMSKMPICRFIATYGECTNPECEFRHTTPMQEECTWYERGFCKYGPSCKRRHTRKRACPNYETSTCFNTDKLGPI